MLTTQPIDWYLDPVTNDLVIGTDLSWTYGIPAVAQGVRIALANIRGEWFVDLDDGVPYFEREGVDPNLVLLGKKFAPELVRAVMRPVILKVPGVASITSLDPVFDGTTRTMTVNFVVQTVFGDTVSDTLVRTL